MIWLSGGCLMIAIFDPLNGVSIFSGFYRESPKPTFNGRRLSGLPENVPKPSIPVFRRNCKWDVRTWKFIFRISPVRISVFLRERPKNFGFKHSSTFFFLFLLVSKQEQNRGDAVSRNLLKRDREISASDRFSPDFVSASRLTNTNGRRVVWRSRSRSEPVECESFILMHWGGENFRALDEPRQTWACQYWS